MWNGARHIHFLSGTDPASLASRAARCDSALTCEITGLSRRPASLREAVGLTSFSGDVCLFIFLLHNYVAKRIKASQKKRCCLAAKKMVESNDWSVETLWTAFVSLLAMLAPAVCVTKIWSDCTFIFFFFVIPKHLFHRRHFHVSQ